MSDKQTANMEIKRFNHTSIFRLLREDSLLTKQDIVNALQLCLPTVTQNINELREEGLVTECGTKGNTGGRRAITYGIVPDARLAIGLDITRNHVTCVIVDLTGAIIYQRRERKKFENSDLYYRYLGETVRVAVAALSIPRDRVLGVGIGIPGLVTADNQTVFYGEILNFTGATCQQFSKYIPYPTALLNDANAAGFAEIWTCPDATTAFYLMLSNNVGGSVIIDGNTYGGKHIHSSEVGHIRIDINGPECYCGQKGCVDCYLAATVLSGQTDGNLSDYFKLLSAGNSEAQQRWEEYLEHLAFTVNTLYMLFDCPVILGGYVGEYIGDYMNEIKTRAGKLNTFEDNANYLRACSYKTEAIAAGSALFYIARFLEAI